jgi:hypothetical protein
LAVSAFGVSPSRSSIKKIQPTIQTTFTKDAAAASSPLFRDPTRVRGGAVPGWAAYNDALDKKPLITKAMTSLVGWALGDLLAQVRTFFFLVFLCTRIRHGNGVDSRTVNIESTTHVNSCKQMTLCVYPIAFHQRRTIRHEALHHPVRLWFHLPWTLGTLLLQLVG